MPLPPRTCRSSLQQEHGWPLTVHLMTSEDAVSRRPDLDTSHRGGQLTRRLSGQNFWNWAIRLHLLSVSSLWIPSTKSWLAHEIQGPFSTCYRDTTWITKLNVMNDTNLLNTSTQSQGILFTIPVTSRTPRCTGQSTSYRTWSFMVYIFPSPLFTRIKSLEGVGIGGWRINVQHVTPIHGVAHTLETTTISCKSSAKSLHPRQSSLGASVTLLCCLYTIYGWVWERRWAMEMVTSAPAFALTRSVSCLPPPQQRW